MEMDVEEFKQLFLPCHPKLYRIAFALLENQADAEDMVQEAYCKLWDRRKELPAIQNPEAFTVRLIRNLCLDYLRKPKIRQIHEEIGGLDLPDDCSTDQKLTRQEEFLIVRRLIDRLPAKQRQVIRLRGIEDCSLEEIETITGLTAAHIRTLLSRARKAVREQLKKLSGYE